MKKNDVKVSVLCTAYNHEKFLRQCLDGFVMQKTNFKYEVIVHDDASTDGTKKIIEEYVKKYPELIKPIYQTQNQYSIDINIMDNILFPIAKGKYIAICEGDDYWCDENKLQIQYDFMEQHLECPACFHNTCKHDLLGDLKDENFHKWGKIHYLTEKEVFDIWLVHTSSFFTRREYFKKDDYSKKYWFGDCVRLTTLFSKGPLAVLPQVMSVYNYNNTDGITVQIYNTEQKKKIIEKRMQRIEYYVAYNEKTNYRYDNAVKAAIYSYETAIKRDVDKGDFKHYQQILNTHPYKKNYIKRCSLKNKIKFAIKCYCPIWFYKLIKKLKKK